MSAWMRRPFPAAILVAIVIPVAAFGMSDHGTTGSAGHRFATAVMGTQLHVQSGRFFAHRELPQVGFPVGIDETAIPDTVGEVPPIFAGRSVTPRIQTVDRPPCYETTPQGVVIARGAACSRAAQ
jgi:hypothetical protein